MSSSSDSKTFTKISNRPQPGDRGHFTLTVRVAGRRGTLSRDARLTVYDGWDEVLTTAYGQLSATLPKGLYTVRCERAGVISEQVVRLTEDKTLELTAPARRSAIPAFDTPDSHEYYSNTAAQYSVTTTGNVPVLFPNTAGGPMGQLFIFVRAESEGQEAEADLSESLFLYGLGGERLTDFSPNVVAQDRHQGWMAFSQPAPAGSYVLRFAGAEAREMLLTVYEGWQTQVFIPFDRLPRPARASIQLARGGFRPDDELAVTIEAALAGLQSGVNLLSQDAREILVSGKFENPMLGFVGAHLLLLERKPNFDLVRMVLSNLDYTLPASADVIALRIALALRLKEPAPHIGPMNQPPLLRRGLEAVLEAAADNPNLILDGGVIERIAPYVVAESSWTMWSLPDEMEDGTIGDLGQHLDQAIKSEVDALWGPDLGSPNRESDPWITPSTGPSDPWADMVGKALPNVLKGIPGISPDDLKRGYDELFKPSQRRLVERSRADSRISQRDTAKELLKVAADAALRTDRPRPTKELGIPEWVKGMITYALHSGRDIDVEDLARKAKLPVNKLRRWLDELK